MYCITVKIYISFYSHIFFCFFLKQVLVFKSGGLDAIENLNFRHVYSRKSGSFGSELCVGDLHNWNGDLNRCLTCV